MGLDTSHDCWHGAYSAFNRWRMKLAEVAGIPLPLMQGYGPGALGWDGLERYTKIICEADARDYLPGPKPLFTEAKLLGGLVEDMLPFLPIEWESLKPDIMHVLLHHSDCDGEIEWEDCGPLADRLEELLPLLPEGDGGGHIGDWKEKTQQFINGLRSAFIHEEDVDFH